MLHAISQTSSAAAAGSQRTKLQCFDMLRQIDGSTPQLNGLGVGVGRELCSIARVRPHAAPPHEELLDSLRQWTSRVEQCAEAADRGPIFPSVETLSSSLDAGVQRIVHEFRDAALLNDDTDAEVARKWATNTQFSLERYVGERMQKAAFESDPIKVTAVFHTPRPCTPLLVAPARSVPPDLLSPASRGDAAVVDSVARRVESVRDMAEKGAKVVVIYPGGELDNLPLGQRITFGEARKCRNIIDFPAQPSSAFKELSGATYVVGTRQSPYDACIYFRLVQARNIETGVHTTGPGRPSFGMAIRGSAGFDERLAELRDAFGFHIETVH